MRRLFVSFPVIAALFAGCVSVAPPANRSLADPSDPSGPEASASRFRPRLVATTQVYLDPSVGRGAQKMDHSNMQGMGEMEGMDKMENKQPASAEQPGGMQGMDHSKMPGMEAKPTPPGASSPPPEEMKGMDHSKMPGMPAQPSAAPPQTQEAVEMEMKKTSEEMKKVSEELKAKSDAAKTSPAAASSAVIYTCPMHPEIQQPNPGKCPKCGMTLVQKETPRKKEKK